MPIMADPTWRLDGGAASLQLARLSAVVYPLEPARGLTELQIDGLPLSAVCRPLSVEVGGATSNAGQTDAGATVEQYVRGADCVATYADIPAPAMRSQIYWRACSEPTEGAIAAVELLVSVQTSLLDSSPRLATRSEVNVGGAGSHHRRVSIVASMREIPIVISIDWPAPRSPTPRWCIRHSLRKRSSTIRPVTPVCSVSNCGTDCFASGWKKESSFALECEAFFWIATTTWPRPNVTTRRFCAAEPPLTT